jgi:uncharacterized membrane protein YhaH (DUF805 family)
MDFSTAVKSGMEKIGNLEGRSSRAEFWWFVLVVWVAEIILLTFVNLVFSGILWWMLYTIVWVFGFLAILSVAVRRLHDVGQSGWLAVLWLFPCIFLIPLFMAVQPGTAGDNTFGPPPTA